LRLYTLSHAEQDRCVILITCVILREIRARKENARLF